MKKSVIGIGAAVLVGAVMSVMAASEAIDSARVATSQLVVYGTNNASTFAGAVTVAGTLTASGAQTVTGTLTASTNLTVNGQPTFAVVKAAGTVISGPLITNMPAGAVNTNACTWFCIKNGTNYFAIPGFQCGAP
jgi:hypothetical protein